MVFWAEKNYCTLLKNTNNNNDMNIIMMYIYNNDEHYKNDNIIYTIL